MSILYNYMDNQSYRINTVLISATQHKLQDEYSYTHYIIHFTEIIRGQMAFKKGLLSMSGVHNWKERPINSKVSALAAGFLLAIAVTKSS